jgi:DNA polymerase-3 subunit epsilon
MSNSLVFDTETTGLPSAGPDGRRTFDTARLVSVAWILLDAVGMPAETGYMLVSPDAGFPIPESATAVHGISQAHAEAEGVDRGAALAALMRAVRRSARVVGHNVAFDLCVVRNELRRLGMYKEMQLLKDKESYCTMVRGRRSLGAKKPPKLAELYAALFGSEPDPETDGPLHNAMVDTRCCARCFTELEELVLRARN